MREYGTMGRMVQRQSEPPPYQDPPVPEAILLPSVNSNNYLMASEKQNLFMGYEISGAYPIYFLFMTNFHVS
jgi:hypothetical protein